MTIIYLLHDGIPIIGYTTDYSLAIRWQCEGEYARRRNYTGASAIAGTPDLDKQDLPVIYLLSEGIWHSDSMGMLEYYAVRADIYTTDAAVANNWQAETELMRDRSAMGIFPINDTSNLGLNY